MKPLKQWKLVEWAKEHAPDALKVVGAVTGVSQLNTLAKLIEKDESIDEQLTVQAMAQRDLDLKELDLILSDKESARRRQVDLGRIDWMMTLTGIVGLGAFSYLLYSVTNTTIPHDNRELVIHLLGIVEGIVVGIFSFYYGTSKQIIK